MSKITTHELTLGRLENSYQLGLLRPNAKRNWQKLVTHLQEANLVSIASNNIVLTQDAEYTEIIPTFKYEGQTLRAYVRICATAMSGNFEHKIPDSSGLGKRAYIYVSLRADYDPNYTVMCKSSIPENNSRMLRLIHKSIAVLPDVTFKLAAETVSESAE